MAGIETFVLFAVVSLSSAGIGLWLTGRMMNRNGRSGPVRGGMVFADAPRRYEFREGYLLSPRDPNDIFLPDSTDRAAAFGELANALEPLNAELPARLSALAARREAFVLTGRFGPDPLSVAGRVEADRMIVTVGPAEAGAGRQVVDGGALAALKAEAEEMRVALDHGGTVLWKQAEAGQILWANAAYFALVEQLAGRDSDGLSWPVPALFDTTAESAPDDITPRRCRLQGPEVTEPLWFEVSHHRQPDSTLICAAQPVDRLVAAETSLRRFVQTLSQTFAHLPIGLAVFDRNRELILFNPALVTLSTLGVEMLSARPSLVAFLDALRDRQRMPEPKNYRHWRDEIARLEQGAQDGSYQEMWTLPTGQTFRVIGRPHPNGAVAFMFEDITSEVSLTRKFRGDLDLYQAVMDDLPGALAVFSNSGILVLANAAYCDLWQQSANRIVGMQTLPDAMGTWAGETRDAAIWAGLRRFASASSDRTDWSGVVTLADGRALTCRAAPLAGGAISVRFLDRAAAAEIAPDDRTGVAQFLPRPREARRALPSAEAGPEDATRPAELAELAEEASLFVRQAGGAAPG